MCERMLWVGNSDDYDYLKLKCVLATHPGVSPPAFVGLYLIKAITLLRTSYIHCNQEV